MDGELVRDRLSSGEMVSTLLVFDALAVRDISVMELSLENRLRAAYGEVVLPLQACPQLPTVPFVVTLKPMFPKRAVGPVLRMIPDLPHENDGLIFTRADLPYVRGKCDRAQILKFYDKLQQ